MSAAGAAGAPLTGIGDPAILSTPLLALFCSVRCPGDVILKAYDLAVALRGAGIPVISGFHSPMERECLDLLLRGDVRLVVCPARSIEAMRLPRAWSTAIEEGRMLIVSPFAPGQGRVTLAAASRRNHFAAAVAERVLVGYAEPGGMTEQLCRDLVGWGKPLYTLESPSTVHLVELGADAVSVADARLLGLGQDSRSSS